jgi:hypothetical protein
MHFHGNPESPCKPYKPVLLLRFPRKGACQNNRKMGKVHFRCLEHCFVNRVPENILILSGIPVIAGKPRGLHPCLDHRFRGNVVIEKHCANPDRQVSAITGFPSGGRTTDDIQLHFIRRVISSRKNRRELSSMPHPQKRPNKPRQSHLSPSREVGLPQGLPHPCSTLLIPKLRVVNRCSCIPGAFL